MHPTVPGSIALLYYLQHALRLSNNQINAWLGRQFYNDISFWRLLMADMDSHPSSLAEIFKREPSNVGFLDASSHGAGGVWIDPNGNGLNYLWQLPWPLDIMVDLVSHTNMIGWITNSDLNLATLVLQEGVFPTISPSSA